jgi:hypothetical protein
MFIFLSPSEFQIILKKPATKQMKQTTKGEQYLARVVRYYYMVFPQQLQRLWRMGAGLLRDTEILRG